MSNIIVEKSENFAVEIVKLYKYLIKEKNEFILSKQVLRSGTSIGANIAEGQRGQSKADFHAKMNIALKEATETEYWLKLLNKTDYISDESLNILNEQCTEIIKILISIVKNS